MTATMRMRKDEDSDDDDKGDMNIRVIPTFTTGSNQYVCNRSRPRDPAPHFGSAVFD